MNANVEISNKQYAVAEAIVEFLLTFTNEPVYDEESFLTADVPTPVRPWDHVARYLVRGVSKSDCGWGVTLVPTRTGVQLTLHCPGEHGTVTHVERAADGIRWLRYYLADDFLVLR